MKAQCEMLTRSWSAVLVVAGLFLSPLGALAGWVAVNPAPDNIGLMLLLSDGSVMCKSSSNSWYQLVPDQFGSYANGSWTNISFMHHDRSLFAADILPDGTLFVAGGEHPDTTNTANAELYTPTNNTWTEIDPPVSLFNPGPNIFSDMISMVTSFGAVLMAPVRPASPGGTLLYYPQSGWALGPTLTNGDNNQDECGWVMLADGSILTVDQCRLASQRFIPSLNRWIRDASTPAFIWNQDPIDGNGPGCEVGPMLALPNGQVFYVAGTGSNVLYTPSGSTNEGTWTQTTDLPGNFLASDCPGAVMPNGKVLFMAATNCGNGGCNGPWHFFEYDYTANPSTNLNEVAGPPSGFTGTGLSIPLMLDLPDGTVLLAGDGSQLFIYQPGGPAPKAAWKPTIQSITENPDGSYLLTGTGLNGVTEGAAEGDDAQMASDYPLVRLTDGGGDVYYARTYNWSSTTIQTGSTPVSTYFKLPAVLPPGNYSLVVTANGIASDPFTFYGPVWVDFNYTGAIQDGTFTFPYKLLASGVSAVATNGNINIKSSSSTETFSSIAKPMRIHSVNGASTVGN